ncbi:MAG: menaquinone biosynthesis protein [Chitinophagaceae bacterium]|nr:menaquinone biosynthesis protein [Chitinophagaceae bacterium]
MCAICVFGLGAGGSIIYGKRRPPNYKQQTINYKQTNGLYLRGRKNTDSPLEKKIRVGAVSYLNTKPLLYGIEQSEIRKYIDLSVDYPSEVARKLKGNEIDTGLVPVAVLPELADFYIDADYCIGANGPVKSVSVFSDVPLSQVETILLDYQSRTSVALTRILLKHHWKLSPKLVPAYPGYQEEIKGTTAGVVIGDRAFLQRKVSKMDYDLAEAWKDFTGLPFVFAAWVANKELPETFIDAFNSANEWGLSRIDQVVEANPFPHYDLHEYYTHNISYLLDETKRLGMQKFLEFLKAEN